MKRILMIQMILLVLWPLRSGAEDASYDGGGLKFSGSVEAVQVFKEAWVAYHEADRIQRQIREQKLPSNPENDKIIGEASSRWYASRKAMYQAALVLKISPGAPNAASAKGVDMLGTKGYVHALNEFMSAYQAKCADNPALYVDWLREMLPAWKDCAGEADILLALGQLCENDPAAALTYYDRASKNASDVDTFQFRRQEACQGVARMQEKLGHYHEALEALNKWEISEPCGTGANNSRIRRMFWMWRLRRLSGEDPMALRRELVHALLTDGWLISCAERDIIDFYGQDKTALRQDILGAIHVLEKPSEESKTLHEHDIKVLKAIVLQQDEEEKLSAMTDDKLIQALQVPKYRDRDDERPKPMHTSLLFHHYMEQDKIPVAEIPEETRYWVRAAHEALKRMPAIGSKLQVEWRKNHNYSAAMVLALHASPDEPAYLREASKSDDQLQIMLDTIIRERKEK